MSSSYYSDEEMDAMRGRCLACPFSHFVPGKPMVNCDKLGLVAERTGDCDQWVAPDPMRTITIEDIIKGNLP